MLSIPNPNPLHLFRSYSPKPLPVHALPLKPPGELVIGLALEMETCTIFRQTVEAGRERRSETVSREELCPTQELLCPGSCRPSPCLLPSNREAGMRADRRPSQRPPTRSSLATAAPSSLAHPEQEAPPNWIYHPEAFRSFFLHTQDVPGTLTPTTKVWIIEQFQRCSLGEAPWPPAGSWWALLSSCMTEHGPGLEV